MRYSTGGVRDYIPNGCGGPDLPATIDEVRAFRLGTPSAGHTAVTTWENGDVWGSDFRDDGGDIDPSGGSELPEIYLFAGHGSCQNPSERDQPRLLHRMRELRYAEYGERRHPSRWGNAPGNLQFMFVDASCPMDLVSLANNWFPVFAKSPHGHRSFGNGQRRCTRQFHTRIATRQREPRGCPGVLSWLFPNQSVGDAWMDVGTIDIQSGCSAVAIAVGRTEARRSIAGKTSA